MTEWSSSTESYDEKWIFIKQNSLSLSLFLFSPSSPFSSNSPFHRMVTEAKKVMKKAEIQIPMDERGDRWSAETAPIG